jgi:CelD/BcsL family acetyltransferase involved in cellulose biosynthesis
MSTPERAAAATEDAPSIRLDRAPSLDALGEEWDDLARATGNIFTTREWASMWWRVHGREEPPLIVACRSPDNGLVAVLALYLWSLRPVRVARFIGHGPADQLGPVCLPSSRYMAARALRTICADERLDVLLAELLPGGQGWGTALDARPLKVESSPMLALGDGWDAYLAGRSANFRQQVRRRERRLRRRHAVRFRLTVDPSRLQADLDTLFSLHRARWGTARTAFLRWEGFHREFAAVALGRGWLRLWFLDLDDRPVAAWYGFRFAGIESYYQGGRDPSRGDESVGFVLLAHTIREAAEDGMREYRLLRGAEDFKRRFAGADPGVETFVLARGVTGRLARAVAAAGLHSDSLRVLLRRLAVR